MDVPAGNESAARLLLCAHTRVYREGLVDRLSTYPDFRVVGSVACGTECIAAVARTGARLVLLDVGAAGAETALRVLTHAEPAARVVALAMPDLEAEVLDWVKKGAAGFVTVEDSVDDLVATLRSVARGEGRCTPRMVGALVRSVHALAEGLDDDGRPAEPLTARELEIAIMLERGLSNKQIAVDLSIELPTVKNHVHSVLTKLHVGGRAEAGARLRALGLAPRPLAGRTARD
jgi:DNA-binding NarL/FixJ family response regulator